MLPYKGYSKYIAHLIVILGCLITIVPFLWILMNSFKFQIDIYSGTLIFDPTLKNYERLLFSKQSNFLLNVKNSAIVAVVTTVIVMIVSTLAAYSLSRFKWSGIIKGAILGWILIFHMIPPITLVGPWYLIARRVGLYNTLPGLIFPYITLNLSMSIWLLMGFLQDVPYELEEAALIDGCRRFQAFIRVVIPLIVPGLIAAGVLTFIFSWNEFSIALNLTSLQSQTIPVGIAKFVQQNEIRHGEMAASSILSTIPALLLMFFGQRFIVKGLTLGALK